MLTSLWFHAFCQSGWLICQTKPFGVSCAPEVGSLQDNGSGGGAMEQQQQQQQPQNVVSICSVQGGRSYMEDEFFVSRTKDFAAVFDGHGGGAVSRYLRQNLYANLKASLLLKGS